MRLGRGPITQLSDLSAQMQEYYFSHPLNGCHHLIKAAVSDGLEKVDSLTNDDVKKIIENLPDAKHLVALAYREWDGDYRRFNSSFVFVRVKTIFIFKTGLFFKPEEYW